MVTIDAQKISISNTPPRSHTSSRINSLTIFIPGNEKICLKHDQCDHSSCFKRRRKPLCRCINWGLCTDAIWRARCDQLHTYEEQCKIWSSFPAGIDHVSIQSSLREDRHPWMYGREVRRHDFLHRCTISKEGKNILLIVNVYSLGSKENTYRKNGHLWFWDTDTEEGQFGE